MTPEQRERLRRLHAEADEYDRQAREILARAEAMWAEVLREREEREARRRRVLKVLFPFRRAA